MNTYSLTSDSPRWWWPSAAAGTAGAAAIAAILVLPGAVQASPTQIAPAETAYSVVVDEVRDGQCFLLRARWNEGLDGFQPRCAHGPAAATVQVDSGAPRPGLTYLP